MFAMRSLGSIRSRASATPNATEPGGASDQRPESSMSRSECAAGGSSSRAARPTSLGEFQVAPPIRPRARRLFGLVVLRLAGDRVPEGGARRGLVPALQRAVPNGGDQQLVLPAAERVSGRELGGPGSSWIRVRGEARPVRVASQEAERCALVAAEPSRSRRTVGFASRPDARAAAAALASQRRAPRGVLRRGAHHDAMGGGGARSVVAP